MSMKTKIKAKPAPVVPTLPTGCESVLSKAQICHALQVSMRQLEGWIAAGEYPPADVHLDSRPRWRLSTHNAWLRKKHGITED